ncbi:MAG: YgiT-type zinc finger protein [candidate division KSB1 bacterium]|nr:YgiT-type zinc finger protein [candidate division KSB1 bacterium]MDZ7366903.1 YgiT-type zinc finger protein [candidate division KSB1 bacterium]MDZ7406072.1 YgiT-type zinc finger protein [candidate division KSB1 bacterium]
MKSNQKNNRIASGEACEYCNGIVRENILEREVFRHRSGLVILEHVPVGVCDKCGERYYSAEVLHRVHNIATARSKPLRKVSVPIAKYA